MTLAPGSVTTAAGVSQSGTSQATPHVAGAVAVLFGAAGATTMPTVETALRSYGDLRSSTRWSGRATTGSTSPPRSQRSRGPTITTTTTTPPPGTCTIDGTDDGEVPVGTPGDDVICGKGGGDVAITGGGNDTVIGGGGFDFARCHFATKGIRANLGKRVARGEGIDTLTSLEGFIGGSQDDQVSGNGTSACWSA